MSDNRIIGIDLARAIAVFIMVFVNFEMVLAVKDDVGALRIFFALLHGKGAALFVVLAGVGISLITKSARAHNDDQTIRRTQITLLKRAAFLFILGLLYLSLWPADILHFYGVYILIAVLMIRRSSHSLWWGLITLILIYPLILTQVDYDTAWDWGLVEYSDFWTPIGFLRNLFINGFHPVIPWLAFVFAGLWLGRKDLLNSVFRRQLILRAGAVFIVTSLVSQRLLSQALSSNFLTSEDAIALFGTEPMPPLPLYMISAISLSFIIIGLSVALSEKYPHQRSIHILVISGQMALTHYVSHIVIGMLAIYILFGENSMSLKFTFYYALAFCVVSLVFSVLWRKRYPRDPMSKLMRWITG